MVPDDTLTIRERAIASWPPAWHGQNLRDILVTLGYDVDRPWRELPKKDRDWILFTEETPTVPVYAGFAPAETRAALKRKMEPSYMGTFTGARRYVLHTFANTQSALMRKRVSRFMEGKPCPTCHGKRLKPEALSVTFAGVDIGFLRVAGGRRLAGGPVQDQAVVACVDQVGGKPLGAVEVERAVRREGRDHRGEDPPEVGLRSGDRSHG